jgi:hypothetical protein
MKTHTSRGISLVELMVAMTLSTLVLGGVMSTMLFISRSSIRVGNYFEMERQTTAGLEKLGRELRMTKTLTTSGNPIDQISLVIPNATGSGTYTVVYAYNSTAHTLSRQSGGTTTVLVRDIVPGSLSFKRFDLSQHDSLTDYDTNQLQITMTLRPSTSSLVASTSKRVISSRFVLRNR